MPELDCLKPESVYFFGTCLIDTVYPQAGMAAIRLIQSRGVRVIFPSEQSCCGQPAYNSGFPDAARAVARKQIAVFNRDIPIVVPSGSCAGMMKLHYPKLFAHDPDLPQIRRFSERIVELGSFLNRVLGIRLEDRGRPITVTWHSSCHAAREMGVIADSKSLIAQLKNVRLKELENEDQCCGFGGTFSVKQPEISAAMVADKIEDIQKTGAERVLSGDCGCLMNISGAMQHAGMPIKSQHLAEFIWERIHG
jgi:L-lactate dehydrogenase complex protein LldE